MSKNEDSSSTSVERAISILEAIAQRGSGMTNSEISRRLEIPKSSASNILRVLERRGYLMRDLETNRYDLGLRLLALGRHALSGVDEIRDAALPVLRALVERSHLTANLAVFDRGEVVYVEKVEGPGFIKMDTWVGRRNDTHSTSVGKAMLAFMAAPEVEAALKDRALRKRTPKTITAQAKLMRELATTRERGYALDDEENSVGVRCIAAPVLDGAGRVLGAINVTATTSQLTEGVIPKTAELVKDAAKKVSHQFRHRTER